MKNTNIEVEGGEILLQSKEGHYAVIPTKHRQKVMDMVDEGCDDCINSYIQTLPKESDYAEDGSLVANKTVSQIWKEKTGTEWKEAHNKGLTKGSYDDNMALRKRLLNGEFNNNTSSALDTKSSNNTSFSDAFAQARKEQGSDGKFEWNGRLYSTKYKNEISNIEEKPVTKPVTPTAKPTLVDFSKEKDDDKINKLFEDASKKTSKRPIIETPTAKPINELKDLQSHYSSKIDDLFTKAINKAESKEEQKILTATKNKLSELKVDTPDYNKTRQLVLAKSKELIQKLKEQNVPKEPGVFDNIINKSKKTLSDISDYIDNAEGYINKLAMEYVPNFESNDVVTKEQKVSTQKYIAPQTIKEDTFKSTFNEPIGYQGEIHKDSKGSPVISNKSKTKIHSFSNAFDNKKGYNYTAIPNKGNHVDSTYNSPGVAHFLLDSDLSQKEKYQHEYSKNMINRQLEGKNIQEGSTVKEQYFPIYNKTKEGKVNLKYKTKSELNDSDKKNIAAPLRQYRFSDIDWDQKPVQAQGFNNTIVAVPTKQKDSDGNIIPSHLIYGKSTGKGAYGDFSGTSVVFIVNKNGERLIIDYANSVQNIQNKAKSIINSYDIKPEDLIIGVHDLGSFNSKPVGENNKLKYNPATFNPHDFTGGALAF